MTPAPTALQLDALREIANIGIGHAATALSRMVGGKAVRIEVPRVLAATAEELLPLLGEEPALAAALRMEGALPGRMLLVWPRPDAQALAALLTAAPAEGPLLAEPSLSALAELANTVASACLSAVGTLTRLRLLPSTPELKEGSARDLVLALVSDERAGRGAVVLEARFHADLPSPLSGRLYLVPDREGLPRLFQALGI